MEDETLEKPEVHSYEQIGEDAERSGSERFHRDLIETVKRYPGLYDKSSPDYKKGKDRHEYWILVENEMFKLGYVAEDSACRHIWRKVVRKYQRELVLSARASPSTTFESQWPHFKDMEFMKPFLENKNEVFQKANGTVNTEASTVTPDITLKTLLKKPKERTKHSLSSQTTQPSNPVVSVSSDVSPSQSLFMFVNQQQDVATTSSSSARPSSSYWQSSLSTAHHEKRPRISSHRPQLHNPFDISDCTTSSAATASVFSIDRGDILHDLSESGAMHNSYSDSNGDLKDIIVQMRGAADLVKLLKQQRNAASPASLSNVMNGSRNANFVTTICGLASQLTDSQADRFRKRVLVNCFDIFQQVCAEDGELI